MRKLGWVAFAGYIGTIFLANWAVNVWGIVQVTPGWGPLPVLYAPAAVFAVGIAFTLRDITQDTLGRYWVIAAILLGASASYFVAGSALATASAVAFLLSEAADFAVYTPMRDRGQWLRAVAASNTVGLVVDSIVFLWLAFGSLDFLWGQIVGKAYMTVIAILVLWGVRGLLPRDSRSIVAG